MSEDTNDILAVFGSSVVIRRNTPSVSTSTGDTTDSWQTIATVTADVQPFVPRKGGNEETQVGQMDEDDYHVYFPAGTDIDSGDRIRRNGWVAGDDELEVNSVLVEYGHMDAVCSVVKGHA